MMAQPQGRFASIALLVKLVTLAVIVSACGFHLRGNFDVSEELRTVYLQGENPNSPIVRNLQRSLSASGVTLSDTVGEAPYTLFISDEGTGRRTISVDRGATAEFELRQQVSFELRDQLGETLTGPHRLVRERIFQNDINNVVGKRDEERLIRQEMQLQLTSQIMRRFQALDPKQLRAQKNSGSGSVNTIELDDSNTAEPAADPAAESANRAP